MIEAVLTRQPSTPHGTQGILTCKFGEMELRIATLELPWRENRPNISCIPTGRYVCRWEKPINGIGAYQVVDVDDQVNIKFTEGNFAGDTSKGFRSDSRGCPLVGTGFSKFGDQPAIINSIWALGVFEKFFNEKDFLLEIIQISDTQGGTF